MTRKAATVSPTKASTVSSSAALGPNGTVRALIWAAHPVLALVVTATITAAAYWDDRPVGNLVLIAATVLTGQALLGWHNDLADRERDTRNQRFGKPMVNETLDPGTVNYAWVLGLLLAVPLSVANGLAAALVHFAIVMIAIFTNLGMLRRTPLSPLPWLATGALWPAFLAYSGQSGEWLPAGAGPPTIAICAAGAALGLGVHLVVAARGLVGDREDESRSLPLLIGLKIGATGLLTLGVLVTLAAVVALILTGSSQGLRQ